MFDLWSSSGEFEFRLPGNLIDMCFGCQYKKASEAGWIGRHVILVDRLSSQCSFSVQKPIDLSVQVHSPGESPCVYTQDALNQPCSRYSTCDNWLQYDEVPQPGTTHAPGNCSSRHAMPAAHVGFFYFLSKICTVI